MKAEDFDPYEGKELSVKTSEGEQVNMTLEKIEKLEAKGVENVEDARSEPFALILSGAKQQKMEGQIVELKIGDDQKNNQLYIKPLNQKEDRIIYESIFN